MAHFYFVYHDEKCHFTNLKMISLYNRYLPHTSTVKNTKNFKKKSEKIRSKSNICKNCGSLFKNFNKDTNNKSTIIRKNKNKKFHTKEWEVRTTAKLFNYSLFSSQEKKRNKKKKELSSQNQKLLFRPILFPRKQRN